MPKHLEIEKKTIAISMLCEGNSIRGVERMTGIHRDTIMRLAVRVGNGMKKVQDELLTDLDSDRLELDEALDADTKLVPSWHVGTRNLEDAKVFVADLKSKLVRRPQISTDGHLPYVMAIDEQFGMDVDYGSIVKTYSHTDLESKRRYSSPEVISINQEVMQ